MIERLLAAALATGALAAPAPAAPAMAAPAKSGEHRARTLVSAVSGTNAYVAVVSDGGRAAGYVCDNGHLARWFAVRPIRQGRVTLTAGRGGGRLTITFKPGGAVGRLDLAGQTHRFDARLAHGAAGLYRAAAITPAGTLLSAGWILAGDGTQRGASFISNNVGFARPAPPLDPGHRTVMLSAGPGDSATTTASKVENPGFISRNVGL